MYGAQAQPLLFDAADQFENDVEMYGAQAIQMAKWRISKFENDVEMYGAQASLFGLMQQISLRMMQKCMVLKRHVTNII